MLATIFILSVHCYFQPYEETRANISETIFLSVLSGLGVIQLMDNDDRKRDRINLAIVCIMLAYTVILFAIKIIVFVRNRTKSTLDNEEYERLESAEVSSSTPAMTDQSLAERRERLAFLFSRSTSQRPDEEEELNENDNLYG